MGGTVYIYIYIYNICVPITGWKNEFKELGSFDKAGKTPIKRMFSGSNHMECGRLATTAYNTLMEILDLRLKGWNQSQFNISARWSILSPSEDHNEVKSFQTLP